MSKDLDDLDDLEELDELDELEELEPAELEALPASQLAPPARPAAAPAPAPAPAPAGVRTGPRQLERAPQMLGQAGLVLAGAALLPWLVPSDAGFPVERTLAKLVILLGAGLMFAAIKHHHGERVPGVLARVAGLHRLALPLVGALLMVAGIAPLADGGGFQAMIEKAAVAIGALVWCQVQAYAKGGKFNPVAGLLIPMLGLGGLGRLVTVFKQFDALALVGSLGVVAAGALAGYTLVVAMKEAKEHGKAKKAAALEARKRERKSQQRR